VAKILSDAIKMAAEWLKTTSEAVIAAKLYSTLKIENDQYQD
jgi:hypothetical protein